MKVRLNEDKEIVARIKEGLKRTGGYCPCRLAHTEENKCMCEEFRNQIKDPNFEGYCHCMLYYKEKDAPARRPHLRTPGRIYRVELCFYYGSVCNSTLPETVSAVMSQVSSPPEIKRSVSRSPLTVLKSSV